MLLTSAFERVYVINLPHRRDRRREMDAELRRIGCDPADVTYFPAVQPADAGPFDSIGARGCFMSHRNLLASARDEGVGSLCIVEDDASFARDLPERLPMTMAALGETDWTMAMLGHPQPTAEPPLQRLEVDRRVKLSHLNAWNGRDHIAELVDFLDAILSRPPGHPDGGPMHVDGAFNVYRQQHPDRLAYLAMPSLAGQRSSRSDINTARIDRTPIVSTLVDLYRRTRRAATGR